MDQQPQQKKVCNENLCSSVYEMSLQQVDELMDEVNAARHDFVVEDPTVLNVLRRYESRSFEGMTTYGTSMHDNPAPTEFWINSAIEEAMDLTLYLQKLLEKLNARATKGTNECP